MVLLLQAAVTSYTSLFPQDMTQDKYIYISKFVMKALFYTCFIESNDIFNIYNFYVELFDVADFLF